MGLPGEPGHVIVHNEFIAGDPRNSIPVGGGPGNYRVIFTLARPGFWPVPEREFSFDPTIEGDSHLAIAAPALTLTARPNDPIVAMKIYAESSEGRVEFACRPNKKGFLGRVETELKASNLIDAERRAYRTLAPALSNWSAQLDIPLRIWRIHVTAMETGATQISITNPFSETAPVSGTGIRWSADLGGTRLYADARPRGTAAASSPGHCGAIRTCLSRACMPEYFRSRPWKICAASIESPGSRVAESCRSGAAHGADSVRTESAALQPYGCGCSLTIPLPPAPNHSSASCWLWAAQRSCRFSTAASPPSENGMT